MVNASFHLFTRQGAVLCSTRAQVPSTCDVALMVPANSITPQLTCTEDVLCTRIYCTTIQRCRTRRASGVSVCGHAFLQLSYTRCMIQNDCKQVAVSLQYLQSACETYAWLGCARPRRSSREKQKGRAL